MTEADYTDLLDLIYEAALEPATWTKVMERMTDALGGCSAWLSRLSVEDNTGDGPMTGIDPSMPGIYRAHFFEGSGDRGPHRKISLWTVHLYAVLLHGAKMRSARE